MDQLQHMRVDFGSRLDHLSDKMCQMNTKIGRIACRQSRLVNFSPSPSSDSGDDKSDDASTFPSDDEMIVSQ